MILLITKISLFLLNVVPKLRMKIILLGVDRLLLIHRFSNFIYLCTKDLNINIMYQGNSEHNNKLINSLSGSHYPPNMAKLLEILYHVYHYIILKPKTNI